MRPMKQEKALVQSKKIKIPNLYDYNNPWEAIPPMDGGWRESPWFGAYLLMENDWMYHMRELGWIYVHPA